MSTASRSVSEMTDPSLVERELLRAVKYKEVGNWLASKNKGAKRKNLDMMLLRFRFNLRARPEDDELFVTNSSQSADEQFKKDCLYFKLQTDAASLLQGVREFFKKAAQEVASAKLTLDSPVILKDGYLFYGSRKYKDIASLGKIDAPRAFALQLRYEYIKLDNQGLANLYTGSKSSGAEAFASAFNHYFDEWCSAFPKLERPFGSRGSFFDVDGFKSAVVHVNPCFDEELMSESMEKIYKLLAAGATNTFIFTIPKWEDYQPLVKLENSKWTVEIADFEKGELEFIDYMTGVKITPCAITRVTLRNA